MYLPDPRLYARVNAQNPIIRLLMSLLTESSSALVQQKREELTALLADTLAIQDHAALNAAMTQAPSLDAYLELWSLLRAAVENAPKNAEHYAIPFAIPVILVAGFKGTTELAGQLSDVDAVLALLKQHEVISPDADVWLSAKLVHAETLASVNPSQLSQWRDQLQYASGGLPLDLNTSPMPLKDEAVFLRYLVGVAMQNKDAAPAIKLGGNLGAWGMQLANLIGEQLKTNGVTLFPIPRTPMPWLTAGEAGRETQLQTRLQLMASNALRSIRSKGRTPVICIAAHENAEIRITFSTIEDAERWEGFVWPLSAWDHVEKIHQYAVELFRECMVSDIRIIENVQPNMDSDQLPFFVTAHIKAVVQH
ncbi:hypothetical protein R6242_05960 [Iodobacter sp. CM08]|uniref:hypothetical protein n=1 Tax=Iodobacter sp. CM08 TaxID=3085902 RepID=UPI0029828905|nr:hypothetical protein [Iodobacter sp. CM08]MDW5416114.1 hypothetical protein [Iodobacter sp. CM08]